MVESGNLVFLYDDESVIDAPYPEFWCDYSKYQPFEPSQDGFGDESKYWRAYRCTLNLLVAAVAKFDIAQC